MKTDAPLVGLALLLAALALGCHSPRALRIENDLGDLQRDYMHATEVSWQQPVEQAPGFAAAFARSGLVEWLGVEAPSDVSASEPGGGQPPALRFRVGQAFYTPVDLRRQALQADDRPYVGHLFAGMTALAVELDQDTTRRRDRRTGVELQLGVVGPSSFAENVQEEWHSVFELTPPRGWGNQLEDEPTLLLANRRDWRLDYARSEEGREYDFLGNVDLSVGNLRTALDLGGALRYGNDLPRDFGMRSQPTSEGTKHLFASCRVSAVARDLFLDGNTWRDSHRVDKQPLVAELALGFSVQVGALRLRLQRVLRSKEFEGQEGTRGIWTLDLGLDG